MANRHDLQDWIIQALQSLEGAGAIADVCRYVWDHHENDLRNSDDLFFTWQYDIRWAATRLRESGRLKEADQSPKGIWELV